MVIVLRERGISPLARLVRASSRLSCSKCTLHFPYTVVNLLLCWVVFHCVGLSRVVWGCVVLLGYVVLGCVYIQGVYQAFITRFYPNPNPNPILSKLK